MSNHRIARAWVEVDLPALRRNYQTIQQVIGPEVGVIVMAKADGYGLGAERVVRCLEPLQPQGYGVATTEEGIALRGAGVTRPILVCEPLPPDSVAAAADAGLTAAISHLSQLERWAEAAGGRPAGLDFHLEIDTGMGRCGLDWREVRNWSERVLAYRDRGVRWSGVFTHFHSADDVDEASVRTQWGRFATALAELRSGVLPASPGEFLVHASNSAATLRFPECRAAAVRPGIFLFGGDPIPALTTPALTTPALPRAESTRTARADAMLPRAEPVVSLRARVILVRDVPPGTTVGYGATYRAEAGERWATLGIGYADGVPRSLSGQGVVLVRGQRAPMVGRISMDLVVVNVTGIDDVAVGDIATLIGRDGAEEITLEEVAARAGTINHEILTGLGTRLPRVERNDDWNG